MGGLDPEALTGKYPPKIRMYSKYERRTDTRTYEDRRKLYEGGWEVVRAEHLQALWKEKYDEWQKRRKKRKRRRKKRKNKCFLTRLPPTKTSPPQPISLHHCFTPKSYHHHKHFTF